MKINEEQFEAHQEEANKQRAAYKATLNKSQLEVFEFAEQFQIKATKANIPFVLYVAANHDENLIYRFHNFFSKRYKEKFSKPSLDNAGKWARAFAGSCFRYLKEICLCRVILKDANGDVLADSDEE